MPNNPYYRLLVVIAVLLVLLGLVPRLAVWVLQVVVNRYGIGSGGD